MIVGTIASVCGQGRERKGGGGGGGMLQVVTTSESHQGNCGSHTHKEVGHRGGKH